MQSDTNKGKKEQVRDMFNNISPKYDFLNHFLSLGIDILWRNRLIRIMKKQQPQSILDVATGTGDLAITASKINPEKIIGVDIAEGMLEVGKIKLRKKNLEKLISLEKGDSENLQFSDLSFDAAMVAFGVRNFEDLNKGLCEMQRVLKPGGKIYVLEFSKPTRFPIKQLYSFYFKFILPLIGRMVSKHNEAYTYLPDSVQEFPFGQAFLDHLIKAGFRETEVRSLSFGIASIYIGTKE